MYSSHLLPPLPLNPRERNSPLISSNPSPRNRTKPLTSYQPLTNQGDGVRAQYEFELCDTLGQGVGKDLKKAVVELCTLIAIAAQGNAKAQFKLGVCSQKGQGIKQNIDTAIGLYQLAAKQGYAIAQYNLGLCYSHGIGVKQDIDEAIRLYRLAAGQRCAGAQYNLGICYAEGRGVEKDLKKAAELLQLAAQQGHLEAKSALSCYLKRAAVNQMYSQAQSTLENNKQQHRVDLEQDLKKVTELRTQPLVTQVSPPPPPPVLFSNLGLSTLGLRKRDDGDTPENQEELLKKKPKIGHESS